MKAFLKILCCIALVSCKQKSSSIKSVKIDTAFLNKYVDSVTKKDFDSITKFVLSQPLDTNFINAKELKPEQLKKLVTCEICGYIAVFPDSGYCFHCNNRVFDIEFQKISEKNKWIRQEQLDWFQLDNRNAKVNFYKPSTDYGFKKDKKWKPNVTEKEVKEFSKDQ